MDVLRSIRTPPQTTRRGIRPEETRRPESKLRLIAKVLRDVAASERFEDISSLRDVLRRRLNRLKIRYQQAEFDDAISVVQYRTPIIASRCNVPRGTHAQVTPTGPVIGRQEAIDLIARLQSSLRARV